MACPPKLDKQHQYVFAISVTILVSSHCVGASLPRILDRQAGICSFMIATATAKGELYVKSPCVLALSKPRLLN